jgi:hypothetical protein
MGLDLILLDSAGKVVGIPRTSELGYR